MALLYSTRYRQNQPPPISPGLLDPEEDDFLGSGQTPAYAAQQQADFQNPQPQLSAQAAYSPQPPQVTNAQAGAAATPLTPLNAAPVQDPPPVPRGSGTPAPNVAPPTPPQGPPQNPNLATPPDIQSAPPVPGDVDAISDPNPSASSLGAKPLSTADKLAALQAPDAPKSNVFQRIALAALAMTRFAPIAPMLVHPVYAEQRAAFNRQRGDLENQLGNEKTEAGIDAETQRAAAYTAAQQTNAEYRRSLIDQRTGADADRNETNFQKLLGPGVLPLTPGQTVPQGWVTATNPQSGTTYIAPPTVIPLPDDADVLKKFPGMKPGQPVPNAFYLKAQQAIWAEQLAGVKSANAPGKVDALHVAAQSLGIDPDNMTDAQAAQLYGKIKPQTSNQLNLSPEAEAMVARAIAAGDTNAINMLGRNTAGRGQILNAAAQLQNPNGPGLAQNTAEFGGNKAALSQLQKQRSITGVAEDTASRNLDLASQLSNQVDRTGSPLLNKWLLAAKGKIAGDPDTQAFESTLQTAVNEYAKVVTNGGTSGSVTDSARKEYERILSTATNPVAFNKIVGLMHQEMANKNAGFDTELTRVRGNLGGNSQTNQTPKPIVQHSASTGQYRYSNDGGKTWQTGQPPQ